MSASGDTPSNAAAGDRSDDDTEELDRHRRRVLWALPTGLYLIGSRHGDEVNMMTANLVVQVCLEPKLVGVALEHESVTARLVSAGGGFTVSLLERTRPRRGAALRQARQRDRAWTRRGRPRAVGPTRHRGRTESAAGAGVRRGLPRLPPDQCDAPREPCLCIGEVVGVGGEPTEVLRMEDTRMHYGG